MGYGGRRGVEAGGGGFEPLVVDMPSPESLPSLSLLLSSSLVSSNALEGTLTRLKEAELGEDADGAFSPSTVLASSSLTASRVFRRGFSCHESGADAFRNVLWREGGHRSGPRVTLCLQR